MWKFVLKFGLIILINLFAFLFVWNILDALFLTGAKFKIIFLLLSIVSLAIIWSFYIRKTLSDLKNINSKNNGK